MTALYGRAPTWAQNLLCSAEGLRLRRQRFSGEFDDRLAAARIREQWTMAQLQAHRLVRVRAMLVHAEQRVPYWRDVFAQLGFVPARMAHLDELDALPVTTKDVVIREGLRMRATSLPHGVERDCIELQTSGTTGAGLRLGLSRGAMREQWAICWRYRMWHGLVPGTWCAQLGGRVIVPLERDRPPYWRTNWPGRQLLLSGYHLGPSTADHYLEEIAQRRIQWIHGYPSMIAVLADAAASSSVRLPALRWVTLASESLHPAQRRRIVAGFGVVPREHYAQTESIANFSECPLGRLHVDEDHAHVEFIPHGTDANGRATARVVGTALDNWHQPFVRYDTGDLVVLSTEACACGRPGRIVDEVDGRREDVLVLRNGAIVGRADHIFKSLEFIREAQIRQRRAGEIAIHVVPRGPWTAAHEAELRDAARSRLGADTTIDVVLCERIARTPAGKFRMVVREEDG